MLGAYRTASVPRHIENTGRRLDLTVVGPGYLELSDPNSDKKVYARSGRFTVNEYGDLVLTGTSFTLGEISMPLPVLDILVAPDGEVIVNESGDRFPYTVGHLMLTTFSTPECLIEVERGVFEMSHGVVDTRRVGTAGVNGRGLIQNGWLKKSGEFRISRFLITLWGSLISLGFWWLLVRLRRLSIQVSQSLDNWAPHEKLEN